MRTALRALGVAMVVMAIALNVALLAYGDPGALPGPLGPAASDWVIPWAQDTILPVAVKVGLIDFAEAGVPPEAALTEIPIVEAATATFEAASGTTAAPTPTATPMPPLVFGPPVRISAPSIGLDAPVIPVGVTAGSMGTPKTAYEVGWYGVKPGEVGNALFDGHVDWVVNGTPVKGVFYTLAKLVPGDEITVRTGDGQEVRFRVDSNRFYDAASAPVAEIAGPTSTPSLTLITCGGQFDRSVRSYLGRWVVRASVVSP